MTTKIVPGGERVGTIPVGAPALWAKRDRPSSVLRRSGRHLAELYHAVDWGYVGFVVAVIATGLVCLHIAMGGGLR